MCLFIISSRLPDYQIRYATELKSFLRFIHFKKENIPSFSGYFCASLSSEVKCNVLHIYCHLNALQSASVPFYILISLLNTLLSIDRTFTVFFLFKPRVSLQCFNMRHSYRN